MPLEPIASTMEIGCTGFARDLNLSTRVPSKFCALTRRGHLEFGNGIQADAISELLIDARVGYSLAIDGEVILIRTLSIERRAAGNGVRRSARNCFKQSREITPV